MASESTARHKVAAVTNPRSKSVGCAVLTVSDTRTSEDDHGGDAAARILEGAGHRVVARGIVRDDPPAIEAALRRFMGEARVQAIVTTGGTGIAPRDTTIEVVRRLIAVEMPGFGELFRMLSWEEVGASAMLSRAVAGLALTPGRPEGVFVFTMPGSVNAVEVAMGRLIAPELSHLVWERSR